MECLDFKRTGKIQASLHSNVCDYLHRSYSQGPGQQLFLRVKDTLTLREVILYHDH